MKKTRRFASLLIALTLLLLTACGNGSTTTDPDTDGKREVVKLTWLTPGDAGAKAIEEGDRIIQEINERLDIELTVNVVAEGNMDTINVQMATRNMPDVVTGAFGTAATQSWIEDELVVSLNDYFDKTPNIKKHIDEDYSWTDTDGDYYGVPFITQFSTANTLIVMRQDWLDKVGLEYPTTLDEFKAVMLAFTNDDPDGNGENDTNGITANGPIGMFDFVFYALGREYADYHVDNGVVKPWFEADYFIPGMEYIKELWDAGAIDQEFMLNDASKREEKFYQGRSGSMPAPLFRHVSRIEGNVQLVTPDASIAYGLPPKGESGSFGLSGQGKGGFLTAVTANATDKERAAEFIDFLLSKEGNDLLRLGIKDVHYTEGQDGTITLNEDEREKDSFAANGWAHPLAWGSFFWPLESGYLPETEPMRDRALESIELASEAQRENVVKQRTDAEINYGSNTTDIYNQSFLDMMQGKVDIETGTADLISKWRAAGGDEILKEAQAVYDAAN